MSRKVRIFALILLYFLTCGKSCNDREQFDAFHEQQRAKEKSDSLVASFKTDTLSATALLQ